MGRQRRSTYAGTSTKWSRFRVAESAAVLGGLDDGVTKDSRCVTSIEVGGAGKVDA